MIVNGLRAPRIFLECIKKAQNIKEKVEDPFKEL